MSKKNMKCFYSNGHESYDNDSIKNAYNVKGYLLNNNIIKSDKMSVKYSSPRLYKTSEPHLTGHSKSKIYEVKKKRLNLKYRHQRPICSRNVLHKFLCNNNTILLLTFVLFCCWNSVVLTFHLNEESNSVYPKVKSIPSSSFSHKRHSKTIDVFYQSGVSIL